MYASDWIFCLFSNIIPLPLMSDFYDCFFNQGWTFFYKFSLSMLGVFKDKLLEEDEFSGILSHIKFKTPDKAPDIITYQSAQKSSPKNSIFIFNEVTGSFSKQTVVAQP